MPSTDSIAGFTDFQPLPIIPSKFFSEPYQEILNKIDGIVTRSERRLLSLLERYCYKDGKIFPKQKSIAFKLGITIRQVKRLIKSLQEKGFVKVDVATLVDRHLFGKGNTYHLLNNPAYPQMSPEMSPEKADYTIIRNKEIKNQNSFDILEWLKDNGARHEKSIVDALKELTRRWPKIKFPGMYAQQVVDIKSGNYHAQDHAADVVQEAKEIKVGYAKLADKMGFSMERTPQPAPDIDTVEKRNMMRNALFEQFG